MTSPITPRISEYAVLESIVLQLKEILARDSKRPQGYEHLSFAMTALIEEEIIPQLENELDYDPTPQYLYDNTGGEPPVTMAEMHASAWQQHQEMHS
jgi:hypothetical protein